MLHLGPDRDYQIDLAGTHPQLFQWVQPSVFARKTYAAFVKLLDNYTHEIGKAEVETAEHRREQRDFLNVAYETLPMRYAHLYLVAKKKVSRSERAFKQLLQRLWFGLCERLCLFYPLCSWLLLPFVQICQLRCLNFDSSLTVI